MTLITQMNFTDEDLTVLFWAIEDAIELRLESEGAHLADGEHEQADEDRRLAMDYDRQLVRIHQRIKRNQQEAHASRSAH